MTVNKKDWYNTKGWLCDNCQSSNIIKLHPEIEADIFCHDCKQQGYQVSAWYINRNKKIIMEVA
jgi:excinuclease UvrABC ATPase subunit